MSSKLPKISFNTDINDSVPAPEAQTAAQAPRFLAAKPAESAPPAHMYGAAGFAPAGQTGFVQRNAVVLAVAAIFVLTFMLGITTALLWTGDNQQAAAPVIQQEAEKAGVVVVQADSIAQDLNEAVTRAAVPHLMDVVGSGQSSPVVADLTAAVLKGLQVQRTIGSLTGGDQARKAAEAIIIPNNNKLRMLREGVLAGAYTIDTVDENGDRRVKQRTINAMVTSDIEGSMLMQAAADGLIDLPPSMLTADGKVDMDTMMFNLVQTSLANDGTPEGAEAAREMSRKIFAESTVQSNDVGGKRVYIVGPGDSLAYIALQFYGQPSAFQRIFEANRDMLQSPEHIQIGQRLIIPS